MTSATIPAADGNAAVLAEFVTKWSAREPEMAQAEVFCPSPLRARWRTWGALLCALREAIFELSDVRVRTVKGGWWAEELLGLGAARARHPLSQALLGIDAPWPLLARAVLAQVAESAQSACRPVDGAAAQAALQPLAEAIVAVETALFASTTHAPDAVVCERAAHAVVVHLLLQRLQVGLSTEDGGRVPLHLLARHGITVAQVATAAGAAARADWARELLAAVPEAAGTVPYRRVRSSHDRWQLHRLVATGDFAEPVPFTALWRSWRAVRS